MEDRTNLSMIFKINHSVECKDFSGVVPYLLCS